MTGKWFLQEVEHLIRKRNRMVILDPYGLCGFLLPLVDNGNYVVLKTDDSIHQQWQQVREELYLRHKAETDHSNDRVVFYITRDQKTLSFLFDYCHTHGCLDLTNPAEWLKKKLFASTGLQVHLDSPLLMIASKVGMDKDIAWWKKVIQKLVDIIDIETALQDFLHNPDKYMAGLEPDVKSLIEESICKILGQPYVPKLPGALANELVKRLFDGLLYNDIPPVFLDLYYKWADSSHYSPSLNDYITKHKLDSSANPWAAHPDHCFVQVDQTALRKLTSNLGDKAWVMEKLEKIRIRANSKKVSKFVPEWWDDVITLLEFDTTPLSTTGSLSQVAGFYTEKFHSVDRAIRNLYSIFLNETDIIRPLQEHYESLNHELLDRWFSFFSTYSPNQQGWLVNLFKNAGPKTSVIVCDGLRYEIAAQVAESLVKKVKIERQIMFASIPTETETGMSALFTESDKVVKISQDRLKIVNEVSGKDITWMKLEDLAYGKNDKYLGLVYGDIDSASEKLNMAAIKLFDTFAQVLAQKIELLINMGYKEVHLVTDHGFVLTGILDEADKIEPNATGKKEVHERFIRTVEKQYNSNWVEFQRLYGEYNYVYAAKSHRPFKTTGMYGYSHGGITPQETIIPQFVFKKTVASAPGLDVMIDNIKELAEVAGEIFRIQLRAGKGGDDLFSSTRKVKILIFSEGNTQISTSQIITMKSGTTDSFEFSFDKNKQVNAVLMDANTNEQLDAVIIKKSNIRDTGGLF